MESKDRTQKATTIRFSLTTCCDIEMIEIQCNIKVMKLDVCTDVREMSDRLTAV